jgi:hypothetical protein
MYKTCTLDFSKQLQSVVMLYGIYIIAILNSSSHSLLAQTSEESFIKTQVCYVWVLKGQWVTNQITYTGLHSKGSTQRRKLSNKVQYSWEVLRQLPNKGN